MVIIALLLFVAAIFIGWDGYQAYQRFAQGGGAVKKKAAAAAD
jgi:hypothetical protein